MIGWLQAEVVQYYDWLQAEVVQYYDWLQAAVMQYYDWLQVVNNGELQAADDPTAVHSNTPITAQPDVEVVDETKYVLLDLSCDPYKCQSM